jgi:demethylmenaquinone methyltransferase/2-methoxy-6-polyprenyl-1,4-benzoquinol methylase
VRGIVSPVDPLLREQIDYYRARAGEYDQWFLRLGRYDMGAAENAIWWWEVGQVQQALAEFGPWGRVLELAGGTGFWTPRLARSASELTVVDASPEALEINRARLEPDSRVRYVVADLFQWQPDAQYDVVAFTFWLSHVPPELFDAFWDLVGRCLVRHGRVFFVDSLDVRSTTFDHRELRAGEVSVTRELNDGRRYRIFKLFYAQDELTRRLAALGWKARLSCTPRYFLYGDVSRALAE